MNAAAAAAVDGTGGMLALWACLNISRQPSGQLQLVKHGLYSLLGVVRNSPDAARRQVAALVLSQSSLHRGTTTMIYKAELRFKKAALLQAAGINRMTISKQQILASLHDGPSSAEGAAGAAGNSSSSEGAGTLLLASGSGGGSGNNSNRGATAGSGDLQLSPAAAARKAGLLVDSRQGSPRGRAAAAAAAAASSKAKRPTSATAPAVPPLNFKRAPTAAGAAEAAVDVALLGSSRAAGARSMPASGRRISADMQQAAYLLQKSTPRLLVSGPIDHIDKLGCFEKAEDAEDDEAAAAATDSDLEGSDLEDQDLQDAEEGGSQPSRRHVRTQRKHHHNRSSGGGSVREGSRSTTTLGGGSSLLPADILEGPASSAGGGLNLNASSRLTAAGEARRSSGGGAAASAAAAAAAAASAAEVRAAFLRWLVELEEPVAGSEGSGGTSTARSGGAAGSGAMEPDDGEWRAVGGGEWWCLGCQGSRGL